MSDAALLRMFEIREQCDPADHGKWAIIVDGKVVDVVAGYEAMLTVAYANYGLGDWLCTKLEPLQPHEERWRRMHLAAEAEYASWSAALASAPQASQPPQGAEPIIGHIQWTPGSEPSPELRATLQEMVTKAGAALAASPPPTDPEAPPWLLPVEVAQRIGNEHRVRHGVVQAIAKEAHALYAAPAPVSPEAQDEPRG